MQGRMTLQHCRQFACYVNTVCCDSMQYACYGALWSSCQQLVNQ
jgi:hypothetical protein